jgi:lipid-binding SYLF domain-containing protein
MKSLSRFILPALVLVAFMCSGPVAQARKKQSPDEQRAAIQKMHDEVLAELYELQPRAKAKIKKSEGYAVFSNVGVNLVIASFAGGHGIVVEKGMISDTETYMKMGSAGLGLGLGVKDFRGVFVFYDKDKLQTFVEKGWDFSAQADAAAKSGEKGGAAAGAGNLAEGVEVFQITKNGLALQATLQGTKYWKDKDLN